MNATDRYDEFHAELASGEGMPEAAEQGGIRPSALVVQAPGSGGASAATPAEG